MVSLATKTLIPRCGRGTAKLLKRCNECPGSVASCGSKPKLKNSCSLKGFWVSYLKMVDFYGHFDNSTSWVCLICSHSQRSFVLILACSKTSAEGTMIINYWIWCVYIYHIYIYYILVGWWYTYPSEKCESMLCLVCMVGMVGMVCMA